MAVGATEANLNHQELRNFLGNMCFGAAGLAEGTNANTIKTTNAIHYAIGGKNYYKAATDNVAMTACAAQAANTTCLYVITINSSGTVKITKGTDGVTTYLPTAPTDECVIGAMKIALASGATFTSGTTDLGAANVTDTFADLTFFPVASPL